MLIFKSGKVMAILESRMFWLRLAVELRVMPILENVVLQLIEDVRVLCVIVCLTLGTLLGELINIDKGITAGGDWLKRSLLRGNKESRFTEGFVSACILFCVGSMTIMGSLEAGLHGDYRIILAKSALDFVSSMAFGAAMGFGVTCSALFVLVFQGALTLLAGVIGSALSEAAVTEMSAVGGVILIGMALNMLGCTRERIKVANMLPAIFLPILWFAFF